MTNLNKLRRKFEATAWAHCPVPEWTVIVEITECDCCETKAFLISVQFNEKVTEGMGKGVNSLVEIEEITQINEENMLDEYCKKIMNDLEKQMKEKSNDLPKLPPLKMNHDQNVALN